MSIDKKLALVKTVPFTKVASFINGMPYNSEFFNTEDGVHVAKIGDVTNKRDESEWEFISEEEFYLQKGQLLTDGDILMTLTGDPPDIGKVSYIHNPINASWNQRVAKIRLAEDQEYFISSNVLYVILSTELIRKQLERYAKGIRQRNLGNESLGRLLVPILSNTIQRKIKDCFVSANDLRLKAKAAYDDASNYLNLILGLDHLVLTEQSTTQKRFKDIKVSDRFDAEYYQPKYDELFERLKPYQTKRLSEIVSITKSIEPGSEAYEDEGIPFIRVANLTKFGITDTDIYLSLEKYKDVIRPKKDTILLSKDGSVGIAYKVNKDLNIITSRAILHLTLIDDEIMPDYLTLVLNSMIVKMQAERDAGGSIIQHWKPSEIENVIIPILETEAQQEITNKIRDSFRLREESEHLLNLAKTSVEVAIEQGEDKALYMLENYTN